MSRLRVVTQAQLERLHPDVPEQTLRYRTSRLRKLWLLGASRPYRDSGSAPQHWWPTNAGQALASGEPPPRRGERRAPNPLTLAHNAAISDLYVVLKMQAVEAGLCLVRFDREGQAREVFKTPDGREHAIAPDVTVQLSDTETDGLLAHVEIDLGTMAHARLRTKLGQYLLYTEREAWRGRYHYQPALLFITTGHQRATTFWRVARGLAGSKRWADSTKEWELGLSADARSLERIVTGTRWADLTNDEALTLPQILRRARAPHDRRLADQRAADEKREAERNQLLREPEALRDHIRGSYSLRRALDARLDETGRIALALLLDGGEPINGDEREALLKLGRQISGQLPADYSRTADLNDVEPDLLASLASVYRQRQREQVDDLMLRYGDLPLLRQTVQSLNGGALVTPNEAGALESDAQGQRATKDEQLALRDRYLDFREREARARAREQGLTSRFLKGAEPHLAAVDNEWLRFCERCDETLYPGEAASRPPTACPYCSSGVARRREGHDAV